MKNLTLILAALLLLAGCASAGTQIDATQVSKIEKGVTNQQDIRDMFGSPYSSGITADGETFYIYTFARTTTKGATFIPVVGLFAGGSDTQIETLQIWFDKENKVSQFNFSQSNQEVRLGQ